MSFDFQDYLARHNPEHTYLISELVGGFVNVTVRAICTDCVQESPTRSENDTMVLKYAPPYVAGRGEGAPMTQWRQTVEARALELVHRLPLECYKIKAPQVLKHDVEEHVLAITDLGNLPNLQELFFELGGYTNFRGPPRTFPTQLTGSASERAFFSAVGSRLGEFFALLHSPETLQLVASTPDLGLDYLANPDIETAVVKITAQAREDQLMQFPDLLNPDHERLFQAIREDQARPLADDEKSLVLGDCWPAAVLVGSETQTSEPEIGIIDWEFAKIGRGLHGDIAQLLAHFELFRIAAEHQGKSAYVGIIDTMVQHLMESYARESARLQAQWTQDQQRYMYYTVLRSSLLSQACEMVNCAFWKVWHCEDRACVLDDGAHMTTPSDCVLIKKMIARAIAYLVFAQMTTADFAESRNWQALMEEKRRSGGWGLLGLIREIKPL